MSPIWPPWRANWAAHILRDQFKALRLLQRAAVGLLEVLEGREREFRDCMGERLPDVVKYATAQHT